MEWRERETERGNRGREKECEVRRDRWDESRVESSEREFWDRGQTHTYAYKNTEIGRAHV